MSRYLKDPVDVLDWQINWATWLGVDTIVTSTWTVPTGITQVTETETATAATIWLSGGTAGQSYTIANKIVTTLGRTKKQSITIVVDDL